MLTSVILEQNVLQKWNILFCGLYLFENQDETLAKNIPESNKAFPVYHKLIILDSQLILRNEHRQSKATDAVHCPL